MPVYKVATGTELTYATLQPERLLSSSSPRAGNDWSPRAAVCLNLFIKTTSVSIIFIALHADTPHVSTLVSATF